MWNSIAFIWEFSKLTLEFLLISCSETHQWRLLKRLICIVSIATSYVLIISKDFINKKNTDFIYSKLMCHTTHRREGQIPKIRPRSSATTITTSSISANQWACGPLLNVYCCTQNWANWEKTVWMYLYASPIKVTLTEHKEARNCYKMLHTLL